MLQIWPLPRIATAHSTRPRDFERFMTFEEPANAGMADPVGLPAASASSAPNPLSAKLSQVLGTSYSDYAFKSAVESLGDTFVQNTPSARRQLRAHLELRDLQHSGAILAQYGKVLAVGKYLPVPLIPCTSLSIHSRPLSRRSRRLVTRCKLIAKQQDYRYHNLSPIQGSYNRAETK